MQRVNTEILKKNQNLRNELKELTSITEAWLNSSNKVNYSGPKDPVFVKSSADNSEVSITSSNKPKLSKVEDSTLTLQLSKSILKSKYAFKAETLKGITVNEPSSAPARGNKSSLVSKTNLAPAGKLKNVKMEDDPPLAICKRINHRTCDHAEFMSSMNINQYDTGQGKSSSRSRPARPAIPFPSYIHCGYNDHKSNDCVYYPKCEICGSYDHDTHGHNMIIFLRRGIKPRNPQHVTKNCETCGSNVHTTFNHNDIEWFRKRKALQAKKVESFKASKTKSSSALRLKTPTKRWVSKQN
ncbi:hypothetical protein Tco_1045867 [Tanacetum coccineum]|uniref:Uncharacterized protein n=1 Tax=Tanacetum coccineum TaxID=301880 RepID=A0ABQ5GU19_9ASTR